MVNELLLIGLLLVTVVITLRRSYLRLRRQIWRFAVVALVNCIAVASLCLWLLGASTVTEGVTTELDSEQLLVQGKGGEDILLRQPNTKAIKIQGFGFYPQQLNHLAGFEQIDKIEFDPPSLTPGLVDVHWPKQLWLGEPLTIRGQYQHSEHLNHIYTVKLLDMAGTMVAKTRVKQKEPFSLTTLPKAHGFYQYQLVVENDLGDLSYRETLAIDVKQAAAPRLLVIQSAPSFESKQVKNWAASQGAQLLVLTKLTTGRYMTQAVGLSEQIPRVFSAELLAQTDLLLMDLASLNELGEVKSQWLNQAVEAGLGIMLWVNTQPQSVELEHPLFSSFRLNETHDQRQKPIAPIFADHQSDLVFDLLFVEPQSNQGKAILSTKEGRVLAMSTAKGMGKLGVSVFNQSYRWRLNGELSIYSHYWQLMLSQLARVGGRSTILAEPELQLPRVGARQQVCVLTDSSELKLELQWQGNTQEVPLSVNRFDSHRQCGWYWPQSEGWYSLSLTTLGEQPLDLSHRFAYGPNHWQGAGQKLRREATLRYQQNLELDGKNRPMKRQHNQPIDVVIYWWLLFLSGAILWFERKLN